MNEAFMMPSHVERLLHGWPSTLELFSNNIWCSVPWNQLTNFLKFWGSGKEKAQAPDIGDRFNKLVEACAGAQNPVSEMIITGGALRIIFASATSQRPWEKQCHKTRHSRKTSSRDDPNKSEQELHEEREKLKKQFEDKGWESKALANYTPARKRIQRSRRRLLQTVKVELKERCE